MTEDELSKTYESVLEPEHSYSSIVEKADRLQAWEEGAMYALDLLNSSDEPEQVKKQIFEFSQRARASLNAGPDKAGYPVLIEAPLVIGDNNRRVRHSTAGAPQWSSGMS